MVSPSRLDGWRFKEATTNAPLLTATPSVDAPQSLYGAKVYTSGLLTLTETRGTSNDTNSIYVYAPSEIVFVQRKSAAVELDRHRLFVSTGASCAAAAR